MTDLAELNASLTSRVRRHEEAWQRARDVSEAALAEKMRASGLAPVCDRARRMISEHDALGARLTRAMDRRTIEIEERLPEPLRTMARADRARQFITQTVERLKHMQTVTLKAGEAEYTLGHNVNTLCAVEDAIGMGMGKIAEELTTPGNMKMKTMRDLLRACLVEGPSKLTPDAADAAMQAAGIHACIRAVGDWLRTIFAPETSSGSEQVSGE